MANMKEIKAKVDKLCALMKNIKASDDVKEEVACASQSDQTKIAIELFRSVILRSTMQSQPGKCDPAESVDEATRGD